MIPFDGPCTYRRIQIVDFFIKKQLFILLLSAIESGVTGRRDEFSNLKKKRLRGKHFPSSEEITKASEIMT